VNDTRPALTDADLLREQAYIDGAWTGEAAVAVTDPAWARNSPGRPTWARPRPARRTTRRTRPRPLSALALAVLAERADVLAGVFNVVTGDAGAI
jgi:hypothetical protein